MAKYCGEKTWMYWIGLRSYDAQEGLASVAFLPTGFEKGDLSKLWPSQLEPLKQAECSPVKRCQHYWLQAGTGWGKSLVLGFMLCRYGASNVFFLRYRPTTGSYDEISLLGYNNEPIIFIDDVVPKVSKAGKETWPHAFEQFVKRLGNGLPIGFIFGAQNISVTIVAKIFITSTYDPPTDAEFRRRTEWVRFISQTEFQYITKVKKTICSDRWVKPLPGHIPLPVFLRSQRNFAAWIARVKKPKILCLLDMRRAAPPMPASVSVPAGHWSLCCACQMIWDGGLDEQLSRRCNGCNVQKHYEGRQHEVERLIADGWTHIGHLPPGVQPRFPIGPWRWCTPCRIIFEVCEAVDPVHCGTCSQRMRHTDNKCILQMRLSRDWIYWRRRTEINDDGYDVPGPPSGWVMLNVPTSSGSSGAVRAATVTPQLSELATAPPSGEASAAPGAPKPAALEIAAVTPPPSETPAAPSSVPRALCGTQITFKVYPPWGSSLLSPCGIPREDTRGDLA